MTRPDFFTHAGIEHFLTYAKQYGPLIPLREWQTGGIILRHDVDLSVEAAYHLAKVEATHSVKGTYFFLVSGPYNPFFYKDMLREIAALGIEIGLHFNPAIYNSDLQSRVDEEAKVLELIVGISIQSVSLHDPSGYGSFPLFGGYFNAYDPRVFSDVIYLSDSGMHFRGKNPYAFVRSRSDRNLQILLHPEHFLGRDYQGIFQHHLRHCCQALDGFWKQSVAYNSAFPFGLSEMITVRS